MYVPQRSFCPTRYHAGGVTIYMSQGFGQLLTIDSESLFAPIDVWVDAKYSDTKVEYYTDGCIDARW